MLSDRQAEAFEGIPFGDDTFDLAYLCRALEERDDWVKVPTTTLIALADRILEMQQIIIQTALIQEPPTDPETGALIS
jgi:hypothetical protein